MKKISILLVFVFVFSLFTVGCENDVYKLEKSLRSNDGYTVLVYDEDVSSKVYVKEHIENGVTFVELSIFPILKEMGGEVKWKNETQAVITFGERNFILDTENNTLCEEGEGYRFNYLFGPPGGDHRDIYYLNGKQYITDDLILHVFLAYELNTYLVIYPDEKIIEVGKKKTWEPWD